ncbi:MAG: 6,7-dimethyl-8-ribityllumazine synthase [Planctomycetota bacterium]
MSDRADIPAVCVVTSRYNDAVTSSLRAAAIRAYSQAGGQEKHLSLIDAPGTFELPTIAAEAARSARFGAVVALGCVVRGETEHDRYISSAVAHTIASVSAETGVPIAFGVLTVNDESQARERAGGAQGNKGEEAMRAALDTYAALRAIHSDSERVEFSLDRVANDKTADGAG